MYNYYVTFLKNLEYFIPCFKILKYQVLKPPLDYKLLSAVQIPNFLVWDSIPIDSGLLEIDIPRILF